MSSSPSRMLPEVGSSRPAIMRSVVVLPQPEAPSRAKNVPSGTVRSSGWTAVTSPKVLLIPERVMVMAGPRGCGLARTGTRAAQAPMSLENFSSS